VKNRQFGRENKIKENYTPPPKQIESKLLRSNTQLPDALKNVRFLMGTLYIFIHKRMPSSRFLFTFSILSLFHSVALILLYSHSLLLSRNCPIIISLHISIQCHSSSKTKFVSYTLSLKSVHYFSLSYGLFIFTQFGTLLYSPSLCCNVAGN
jgi:hypothetical protein